MKNLFYFVLGICLIVLTSATTVSVMKIEPAKPKSTIVFYEFNEYDVVSKIKTYVKQGYILKSCNGASSSGRWITVMEKY